MPTEELKQLDEDVCAWWSAWTAYKCETSERHLYMAIQLRHVQVLIDAEIVRQKPCEHCADWRDQHNKQIAELLEHYEMPDKCIEIYKHCPDCGRPL